MTQPKPQIEIFETPTDAVTRAATIVADTLGRAASARGEARVALSGGNTPRALYERLASFDAAGIPWEKVEFYWGDERMVPPDDPESNFKMAWDALLSKVPAAAVRLHRFRTELGDPDLVARDYEEALENLAKREKDSPPRFDLTLLGMGADGHTASLFPGTPWNEEPERWVRALRVEKLATHRLTLLPRLLNRSRKILFLVTGREKAPVITEILGAAPPPGKYPVQAIAPDDGETVWLLDRAAAAEL